MIKINTAIFLCIAAGSAFAQLDLMNKEKNKEYSNVYSDTIVDSTYGITIYEKFNILTDSEESKRMCGKNPCYGIVKDYYTTDTLLHRGNYSVGKLQGYRNYYPTGVLEREIKFVNVYSAKLKLYYPSGNLKSEIHFNEKNPITWIDYFDNGNIDYEEYYNNTYSRLNKKASYYENGTIQEEQILIKKSKLIYSYKTYYENGQVKSEGEMRFMKDIEDYRRLGTWKHYNADGSLNKEEKFNY